VVATATLVYDPADPAVRRVESRRFTFTAPLGPIEANELRWYLESYYLWPTGVFKERAERIEAQLPQWGQDLYHAVVATQHAQEALRAWQHAAAVIGIGLGTDMGYGHLRLDPALPPYLLRERSQADQKHLRGRWAEEMAELVHFLEEQTFQDATIARQLTLLELPNLLTLLRWLQDKEAPETVVDVASRVEALLADLGLPHALLQVTTIREQVAQILGEWSRARFMAESENIERLLEHGALPAAYTAAQHLLEHCLEAGESAYTLAAYDIALAHTKLGRTLRHLGDAEMALQPLTEARERFQALADSGNSTARSMVPVAIAEYGDCLTNLGRLDEAASAYEEVIQLAEHLGDKRHIAAAKGQLGTVRIWQWR
jgi:tetratricopeptide (TPR) repeat protein